MADSDATLLKLDGAIALARAKGFGEVVLDRWGWDCACRVTPLTDCIVQVTSLTTYLGDPETGVPMVRKEHRVRVCTKAMLVHMLGHFHTSLDDVD